MHLVVSTNDDDEMGKWQIGDDNIPKDRPAFQASRSAYGVFDSVYIRYGVPIRAGGRGGGNNIAVSNQMERKNGISIQIHRQYYSLLLYRLSVTSSFFEVCRVRVDADMSCASHQILP